MRIIALDGTAYEKVGAIAAKYVETLQRSNEQLVKVAALVQKQMSKSEGLSDDDKSELYDIIQGNKD